MAQRADGSVVCDGCGLDAGNGGVSTNAILSRLDPISGMVLNFHFCEDRVGEDGKLERDGCAKKLMTQEVVPHWIATQEEKPEWIKTRRQVGSPNYKTGQPKKQAAKKKKPKS